MNTIGTLFRLTTFGESHGAAIGGVVDGMPAGIAIDYDFIRSELSRRRPGQSALTTARREADEVEYLSGIYEGRSTGTPIAFLIRNTDARPSDYEALADTFRPSHADYTYTAKYGLRDPRGGGRASARETAVRVVAGALAKSVLKQEGISIHAELCQVGTETDPLRFEEVIRRVKEQCDSIGGIVSCTVEGCPAGLGEPLYGKLHAALGAAMLSINACHGFDYGDGFDGIGMTGSQQNDPFSLTADGHVTTLTNHSGGIQGGISNGQPIRFRALFKPTPTISQPQSTVARMATDTTVDERLYPTEGFQPITLQAHGRHDPCVALRAVPVVEAMAAIVILDHWLQQRAYHRP